MKVGDILWAAIDENGEILGDGECPAISSRRELIVDTVENCKSYIEQLNHCRIVRVQIVQLPTRDAAD